jgi:hypothetical protein
LIVIGTDLLKTKVRTIKTEQEGYMKRLGFWCCLIGVFIGSSILIGNFLSAQEKGPPSELIRGAYRQILAGADKNGDGKLSMAEWLSQQTKAR